MLDSPLSASPTSLLSARIHLASRLDCAFALSAMRCLPLLCNDLQKCLGRYKRKGKWLKGVMPLKSEVSEKLPGILQKIQMLEDTKVAEQGMRAEEVSFSILLSTPSFVSLPKC